MTATSAGCGSGTLHIRLVGAGEPVLSQPRIDRFLSLPQHVDVGTVGGEAGRDLWTLGNGPVARDQDLDVPGRLTKPVEGSLEGTHLIGGGEGRAAGSGRRRACHR
jgi:hypothetical protein